MPRNKIRHNSVSDRGNEVHEPVTIKDVERATGKAHWVGKSKITPLTSLSGFQLFAISTLVIGLVVIFIGLIVIISRML